MTSPIPNDAPTACDRPATAFVTACKTLGFNPTLVPLRHDQVTPDDAMAELAASLHGERKAQLEAEDKLTPAEYEALQPLLATFRSNNVPQRDIRTVIEQLLMIRRLRCAYRHAPGVKSPDALRIRARSLALREAGSRFVDMSDAAMKESIAKMRAFNEELKRAGILQDCDGLRPSREGKRVHFDGASRSVIDGPFTGELVAGYWIWELPSVEDAISWVKRCPNPMPTASDIEIRPI